MDTFKAVCFNGAHYCKFPAGISNVKEFATFLSEHYHSFVELEVFLENGQTEIQYWNPAAIQCVKAWEFTAYGEMPAEGASVNCEECAHYYAGICEENLDGSREYPDLPEGCSAFRCNADY